MHGKAAIISLKLHHQFLVLFLDHGAIVVSVDRLGVRVIKATFADASVASTTESKSWDGDALGGAFLAFVTGCKNVQLSGSWWQRALIYIKSA